MNSIEKISPFYPSSLSGKTVVVGLSGGVDSSVVAALLKEQGANVIGLFMKNWEEKDERGVCLSSKEFEDVERVCHTLDIPYYSVDFVKEYQESVFNEFLTGYKSGITPNPDILCNREIKFKVFFDKAMELGADYLATGHYCQIGLNSSGKLGLLKGVDQNKDQSYFLGAIDGQVLSRVLFPIGHLEKSEVRELAEKYKLATMKKKDSTGICFIGERNFRPFLSQFLSPKKGDIVELEEMKVVGSHEGVHFYTLGQRKGLGLGGPGEPWFVSGKDFKSNILYVVRGEKHPSLYVDYAIAKDPSWINFNWDGESLECFVKARYRQDDQECTIKKIENNKIKISFKEPQRSVTPGQSAVFYLNGQCIGQAFIESIGDNYYEQSKRLPEFFFSQI